MLTVTVLSSICGTIILGTSMLCLEAARIVEKVIEELDDTV